MFNFDPQKCLLEVRRAETADLLDRVTAYRQGMEPQAVDMIEQELRRRGIAQAQIDARMAECRRDCIFDAAAIALPCSRCRRPAVAEINGWHRLFGVLPVFPRSLRYCEEHQPAHAAKHAAS
jgi:hypothetical protein